jgi:ATP synthase protein I
MGLWIDATWPSRFSWTLMLLVGGILLGCWNAWYWVSQEQARIQEGLDELTQKETE